MIVCSGVQPPRAAAEHRPERGAALLPSVRDGGARQSAPRAGARRLRRHLRQEGHERPAHRARLALRRPRRRPHDHDTALREGDTHLSPRTLHLTPHTTTYTSITNLTNITHAKI